MGKGKPTPDKSKINRSRPVAYARRQKKDGGDEKDDDKDDDEDAKAEGKGDDAPEDKAADSATPPEPASTAGGESTATATADETAAAIKDIASTTEPEAAGSGQGEEPTAAIEPPPPNGEPWPDATPQPMRPVEPARTRTETVGPAELATGSPPVMPGSVEDPTFMPGLRDVPNGPPGDPALPPGRVPSGDSRSLRKGNEFALVYRMQTAVIRRTGVVGNAGQWRVVEYPTSASASNAYAKEVSRFVAEGFSDYRD